MTGGEWTGKSAVLALAALALVGCRQPYLGPPTLRSNRGEYSKVAQASANEQLLLNLVRLRYREPSYFLELSTIASTFRYDGIGKLSVIAPFQKMRRWTVGGTGGNEAGILYGGTNSGQYGGDLTLEYTENPTFNYTPLTGEQFANRMLTDIDIKTFGMLLRQGWRVEMLFRALVAGVGEVGEELRNDPLSEWEARQRAKKAPAEKSSCEPYEKFRDLVKLLMAAQNRGDLWVKIEPGEKTRYPVPKSVSPNFEGVVGAAKEGLKFEEPETAEKTAEKTASLTGGKTSYPVPKSVRPNFEGLVSAAKEGLKFEEPKPDEKTASLTKTGEFEVCIVIKCKGGEAEQYDALLGPPDTEALKDRDEKDKDYRKYRLVKPSLKLSAERRKDKDERKKKGAKETDVVDVPINMNSVDSALFFLAHLVDAPPRDIENKIVAKYEFDWSKVTALPADDPKEPDKVVPLLNVKCETSRPPKEPVKVPEKKDPDKVAAPDRKKPTPAFVSVRYRGHRFYVPDNDVDSKDTFTMMSYLLLLQATLPAGATPQLTLPLK